MYISNNAFGDEEEILYESREQDRSYFRDLRSSSRNYRRYLQRTLAEREPERAAIHEEGSEQGED
jgi:hypothetical protein